MKQIKIILFIFSCLSAEFINAQIPLESRDTTKTEFAFLYYVDSQHLAFVILKEQKKGILINDFSTRNLKVAYQIPWQEISIDTLEKYASKQKIYNYWDNDKWLTIIPVKINYTIYEYKKSSKQVRESLYVEKYKLIDRLVSIKSIGGVALKINYINSILDSLPSCPRM